MQNGNNSSYAVDLVMCIDGTGSMKGIIDTVKQNALDFYPKFLASMEAAGKEIRDDWFRVKVIVFRDYVNDEAPAIQESPFFDVTQPEGQRSFERFVRDIEPIGGGDIPENALEAIFTAIKSDWCKTGGRYRRHAILLFTDAPALKPQDPERVASMEYPIDMPDTLEDLLKIIESGDPMDQSGNYGSYASPRGRLIVYAPEGCGWEWVRTLKAGYFVPTKKDGGCADVDINTALGVLVSSF